MIRRATGRGLHSHPGKSGNCLLPVDGGGSIQPTVSPAHPTGRQARALPSHVLDLPIRIPGRLGIRPTIAGAPHGAPVLRVRALLPQGRARGWCARPAFRAPARLPERPPCARLPMQQDHSGCRSASISRPPPSRRLGRVSMRSGWVGAWVAGGGRIGDFGGGWLAPPRRWLLRWLLQTARPCGRRATQGRYQVGVS